MRRHAREYGLLVVLVIAVVPLAFVVTSRSSPSDELDIESTLPGASESPEAVGLTQEDGGAGGVTVTMTWVTAEDLQSEELDGARARDLSEELVFRVTMETDSVDLAQYDLRAISVLRDSEGREFAPQAWESLEEDPFYRDGLLVFQRPPATGGVQVIILGLAGTAQRVFDWDAVPSG